MKTSRRGFVINSALAAAGMVYSSGSFASINQAKIKSLKTPDINGPARICIFSKNLGNIGYDEMASLIAEAGFDGIDLTVRMEGHVLPENVERDLPLAVTAAKKKGLKIYMITTDITSVDEKYTEIILKTASSLGIGFYRFGPRFYDEKKSIPQNLEEFKIQYERLSKLNRKYKIKGECQNHTGERFGAAVWDQWEVLKSQDPQWIGVQYDILHATLEGVNSWPLAFELVKPYISTMAMKDFYWKKNNGIWDLELTPLGEGMVDFKKFIALLKKNKMQGPFTIHCEYLTDKEDLQSKGEKIKKDLTLLRRWLNEEGL